MKLHVFRHGHAAQAGNDRDRTLSNDGVLKAQARGRWLQQQLEGRSAKLDAVVYSDVLRCRETTTELLRGVSLTPTTLPQVTSEPALYPVGDTDLDAAFERLGYKPLREYFTDPRAEIALRRYAITAQAALRGHLRDHYLEVAVIAHAVVSAAMGLSFAAAMGVSDEDSGLLDANFKELEGFTIDMDTNSIALIVD